MDRRPVVGVRRDDDDVAVEAHLLAVVLADVRVVPVDAGVGERDACRVAPADRHRRPGSRACRRSGSPAAARASGRSPPCRPRSRRRRATSEPCGDPQRRAGDGAVVGEHPHRRVADALGHRRDAQREPVAVGELDRRGGATPPAGRRSRAGTRWSERSSRLLAGFGARRSQSAKHSSRGRPQRAVRRGRWSWGARAPIWPTLRPARGGGASSATSTWRAPVRVLGYAGSVCGPGLATAPRTVATNAASAWSVGIRPARSSALPAWTSAMTIERCHPAGTSARKAPSACPR